MYTNWKPPGGNNGGGGMRPGFGGGYGGGARPGGYGAGGYGGAQPMPMPTPGVGGGMGRPPGGPGFNRPGMPSNDLPGMGGAPGTGGPLPPFGNPGGGAVSFQPNPYGGMPDFSNAQAMQIPNRGGAFERPNRGPVSLPYNGPLGLFRG